MKRNRHSGAGRNPVNKIIHAKRDSTLGFVCFAGYLFNWIPACAGMTAY